MLPFDGEDDEFPIEDLPEVKLPAKIQFFRRPLSAEEIAYIYNLGDDYDPLTDELTSNAFECEMTEDYIIIRDGDEIIVKGRTGFE